MTTGDGAPFVIESQRAWLYATDEVLEAINDYMKAFMAYAEKQRRGEETAKEWAEVKASEGRLRLMIRKDLHGKTRIGSRWVEEEWEMTGSRPERIRAYLGRTRSDTEEGDKQDGL